MGLGDLLHSCTLGMQRVEERHKRTVPFTTFRKGEEMKPCGLAKETSTPKMWREIRLWGSLVQLMTPPWAQVNDSLPPPALGPGPGSALCQLTFAKSTSVFAWSLSFLCSIFTLLNLESKQTNQNENKRWHNRRLHHDGKQTCTRFWTHTHTDMQVANGTTKPLAW